MCKILGRQDVKPHKVRAWRDNLGENAYCLTWRCSPSGDGCLIYFAPTFGAEEAGREDGRAFAAPGLLSMLTKRDPGCALKRDPSEGVWVGSFLVSFADRRRPPGRSVSKAHGSQRPEPRGGVKARAAPRVSGLGLCAGHARRPGGESPLCNLMEVKHEQSARAEPQGTV